MAIGRKDKSQFSTDEKKLTIQSIDNSGSNLKKQKNSAPERSRASIQIIPFN